MRKYAPPALTGALVAIDAMEREVKKVMEVANVTMINVPIKPTLPTTHPKRKYMITPNTVSIEGVNTPPKVFKPRGVSLELFLIIINLV